MVIISKESKFSYLVKIEMIVNITYKITEININLNEDHF